jgi:ribokinase
MQPGDYLLAQNELNDTAALLSEAAGSGLRVVLNPAPFTDDVPDLPLQSVHTLIVNEVEGEGLTGERDEEKIARKIQDRWGNPVIIVTLGSRGSYCLEQGQPEPVSVEAPRVEAVDTTAAGDCFIGYYLASKLQGLSTLDALQRATRASALCVTRPGAAPSIPSADEV